ncbi:MAG TPA: ferredoxin [Chloroflexota bacterium]|nr:ferredoxin [Chloroflexota bacterium]
MRVRVDPTKCEAFGKCAEVSPDVFKLDEFGYAGPDDFMDVPAEFEAKVRQAEAACPTGAVVIEE